MATRAPWWWPELADDDERDHTGWRYTDTWDHLGDARSEYEKLADAFLGLVAETGKRPEDFDD